MNLSIDEAVAQGIAVQQTVRVAHEDRSSVSRYWESAVVMTRQLTLCLMSSH